MRNKLRNPLPLRQIIPSALKYRGGDVKRPIEVLQERWPQWVGPLLARKTLPLKIRGKRLIVGTLGPVWSQELELLKAEIFPNIHKDQPDLSLEEVRFQTLMRLPGST